MFVRVDVMSRFLLAAWLTAGALTLGGCSGGPSGTISAQRAAAPAASTIQGPLRVHPVNSRYFTDDGDRVVYLTGSHTWVNLQDVTADTLYLEFENRWFGDGFSGYLDWLQRHGHNFIRLWTLEHTIDEENGATIGPHPWRRTGPGRALDGKLRFDLEQPNDAYFERLRERVAMAQRRGIYVSVMLFEAAWRTHYPITWKGHPFNAANNINGVNADANADGVGHEFHSLAVPRITRLQAGYVERVVRTLNGFDNVLYEVANESGYSRAWQYQIVELVRDFERHAPKQHPVGVTVGVPAEELSNQHLMESPADWISPSSDGGYKDNPPPADGRKVILADTDHLWGVGGDGAWVWKSFLRGLNPILMDPLNDMTFLETARRAMGDTAAYARRVNLAAMTPRPDLATSTYCLASPGSEYLVYLPVERASVEDWVGAQRVIWRLEPLFRQSREWVSGAATTTVDLRSTPHAFLVEWFNPRERAVVTGEVVHGGQRVTFRAPFSGEAVLYLRARGRDTEPPPDDGL